jgi:nicotinic acid mononucleotide adenylyltransferase
VGTAALMEYYQSLDNNSSAEYYFCLGADAFLDLLAGKWKESQRVLDLLQGRFVVFHRHSADIAMLQDKVQQMPGAQLLEVESLTDVSSSQVRQCSDESKLSQMVTPSVLDYIKEHKLYQFDDTR